MDTGCRNSHNYRNRKMERNGAIKKYLEMIWEESSSLMFSAKQEGRKDF